MIVAAVGAKLILKPRQLLATTVNIKLQIILTYIYAFVLSFVLYPRPLNYRVHRSSVFSLKAFRDVSRSSSKLHVKLVRKTREFIDR